MKKNKELNLKLPKESLIIENQETNEIIAINGRWKRSPDDGEKLVAYYKYNYQKYND